MAAIMATRRHLRLLFMRRPRRLCIMLRRRTRAPATPGLPAIGIRTAAPIRGTQAIGRVHPSSERGGSLPGTTGIAIMVATGGGNASDQPSAISSQLLGLQPDG
jgi:hypothetical protein